MDVMSFRTPGQGDQTYRLTYDGTGAPVDPQRDVDRFRAVTAERDIELRFVPQAHLQGVPPMPPLTVPERSAADLANLPPDAQVMDARPRKVQACGLLPGSLGVAAGTDFGSWVGWLLPYQSPIVLVQDPDQDVSGPVTQLAQIGVGSLRGVIRALAGAETTTFGLPGHVDVPIILAMIASSPDTPLPRLSPESPASPARSGCRSTMREVR